MLQWELDCIQDIRLDRREPPTSSQVTFGIFGAPMASAYENLALPNAEVKSLSLRGTRPPIIPGEFTDVGCARSVSNDRRTWSACSNDLEVALCTRLPISDANSPAVCIASLCTSTSEVSGLSSKHSLQILVRRSSFGGWTF